MTPSIQKTFPDAVQAGRSRLSASCNIHSANGGSAEGISSWFSISILDHLVTQIGMEDFRDE